MVLVLLISLNCCMSTLHLVYYTLLLTPACWKSNNTNVRLMASATPLALDPTFGIHSHKTLDTAQPCHLLKPNWKPSSSHSICILTNISTLFLLQSAPLAEVINILRSFLKCTGTCTIGTLHLPRNQSLFYESFNGTFRWEILHSKTIKGILHSNTIKGIF